MKNSLMLMVLAVVSVAGCTGKPAPVVEPQAPAGGRIEVAEPSFDNGVTVRGEVIRHTFKLKNIGDSPVTILDVKASCSCTAAVVSESVVEPGAEAAVEVNFNTRGRSGAQSKSVKVLTNSATTPVVILTVSGKVEPAVAFAESNLMLGQVMHGSEMVREVGLIGLKADGVKLTGVKVTPPDDPRLTASIVESEGKTAARIVFVADERAGLFRGRIDGTTDSPEVPEIYLTVHAEVTGEIVADPPIAVFPPRGRLSEAGKTRQAIKVTLKSLKGAGFKVSGVEDQAGLVRLAAVNPVDDGLELTLEGPVDANPSEGVLTVGIKGCEPLEMRYTVGKVQPARSFRGPGGRNHPGRIPLPGDVRMIKGKVKPWEKEPGRPVHKPTRRKD